MAIGSLGGASRRSDFFHHFFVQEFVGGENGAFFVVEGGSVNVGDAAAGLFEDYASGCDVPNFETEFPGAVDLAGGYKAKIKCG